MSTISLLDLPVEILHLICDHLDTLIILRSIRYVCKRLYAVGNSYNRYKIDISSMPVSVLKYLSSQIRPENIISLTVSTDYWNRDQSTLFRSSFDICRFTQLHLLSLFDVTNNDFQYFFQLIHFSQVQ